MSQTAAGASRGGNVRQLVIENPIINSPFDEPRTALPLRRRRHHRRDRRGAPRQRLLHPRRRSPRRRASSSQLDTEWTDDRHRARTSTSTRSARRVGAWRRRGYPGVTPHDAPPARVLAAAATASAGSSSARSRRVETAIYLTEVRRASTATPGSTNELREANEDANPGLYRMAFKMATGSGKTVVMAMLIAWHALNKLANPQDARFTDAFLIVTPGITIRDRLRVLLPNDPSNYYRQRDIVPARAAWSGSDQRQDRHHQLPRLPAAREGRGRQADQGASWPAAASTSPFTETPDQMVRRVCRELGNKQQHRRHQRRGAPLLPRASRDEATDEKLDRRRAQGGREARRGGPGLDHRPRGGQAQDRHQGRLRPLGDAVLPARLRLPRGHAVPLGRVATSR